MSLAAERLILPDTVQKYARGQIVLWTPYRQPAEAESDRGLAEPAVRKVAIANPDRAPYGLAAREALKAAGVWEAIQPKIVIAENIQQTHQYAETGNVDAAIGALSLSVPAAAADATWPLCHCPPGIVHTARPGAGGDPRNETRGGGACLAAFMNGSQGSEVLQRYGLRCRTRASDPAGGLNPRQEGRMNWASLVLSRSKATAVATILIFTVGLALALLFARRHFPARRSPKRSSNLP